MKVLRPCNINVRATKAERAAIRAEANRRGLTISDLVRDAAGIPPVRAPATGARAQRKQAAET